MLPSYTKTPLSIAIEETLRHAETHSHEELPNHPDLEAFYGERGGATLKEVSTLGLAAVPLSIRAFRSLYERSRNPTNINEALTSWAVEKFFVSSILNEMNLNNSLRGTTPDRLEEYPFLKIVHRELTRSRSSGNDAFSDIGDTQFAPRNRHSRRAVAALIARPPICEVPPYVKRALKQDLENDLANFDRMVMKKALKAPSGFESNNFTGERGRGVSQYLTDDTGLDVLFYVDAVLERSPSLRFLDIGSHSAKMLFGLKILYGSKVHATALDIDPWAHYPVDKYVAGAAEYLPHSFKEQFDVIVSNRALEYCLFPHLAFRQAAHALAKQGSAILQFRSNRLLDSQKEHLLSISEELGKDLTQTPEDCFTFLAENCGMSFSDYFKETVGSSSAEGLRCALWIQELTELHRTGKFQISSGKGGILINRVS